MINSNPSIISDLVNSFRFYIMLGIILSNAGEPEKVSSRAFKEYFTDLKNSGLYSDEVIRANIFAAYKTLPSEFLKGFNIEVNPDDRFITIVEEYHKPSGR